MTAVDLGPGERLPRDEQPKRILCLRLCNVVIAADVLALEDSVTDEVLVRSERTTMEQRGEQRRDTCCDDPEEAEHVSPTPRRTLLRETREWAQRFGGAIGDTR